MKKLMLIVCFHFLLGTMFLFQGCTCSKAKIIGTTAFEIQDLVAQSIVEANDTIKGNFVLTQYFDFESVFYQKSNFGINTAYATQPCYKFVNPIEEESLELLFSEAFIFNGQTIPANTNLFDNVQLEAFLTPRFPFGDGSFLDNNIQVSFTENFYTNVVFPEDAMTIRLVSRTSDDIVLESEQEVFMNIQ